MTKILLPFMKLFEVGGVDKSVFRIDTYGTDKGKPRHHYYSGVGHIADITSIPAVEGALMIARGELKKPGVYSADGILDPDDFLPRIQKRGVELFFVEE